MAAMKPDATTGTIVQEEPTVETNTKTRRKVTIPDGGLMVSPVDLASIDGTHGSPTDRGVWILKPGSARHYYADALLALGDHPGAVAHKRKASLAAFEDARRRAARIGAVHARRHTSEAQRESARNAGKFGGRPVTKR